MKVNELQFPHNIKIKIISISIKSLVQAHVRKFKLQPIPAQSELCFMTSPFLADEHVYGTLHSCAAARRLPLADPSAVREATSSFPVALTPFASLLSVHINQRAAQRPAAQRRRRTNTNAQVHAHVHVNLHVHLPPHSRHVQCNVFRTWDTSSAHASLCD